MSRAQHVNLNNAFSEASTKRPTPAQKTEDPEDEDVDSSSEASFDEEQVNRRTVPYWPKYRTVLKQRGFRLDTVRDVETRHGYKAASDCIRYLSSHNRNSCDGIYHDDALCPDVGLPDYLFRGTRLCDNKRIVVKAVHPDSREFTIMRLLTQSPLKAHPLNHTIPVLDLFCIPSDQIGFIVMEEWSSQLITETEMTCIRQFINALRSCFEHAFFLHQHGIAHLDISIRNLVTDFGGRYAYIDYEGSRQFNPCAPPLVCGYRGTEIPPECESGRPINAFKVDIWALGVLVLRACKMANIWIPELMQVVEPMIEPDPEKRPCIYAVLKSFDKFIRPIVGCLPPCYCSPCMHTIKS